MQASEILPEARLSGFFEQSVAGMCETDTQGRFLRVNDRYCGIVGRSREELMSLRMQDITHPGDLQGNLPLFLAAIHEGQGFEIEKRYVRPDGSHVWVHNSVTPIREADGRVGSTVCLTVDISGRRAAEEQLRRVLDQLFAFVGIATCDGTLIEANRAPLEAAGIAAEDVLGKPFWDAYWWSYDPKVQERLRNAVASAAAGETVRYDVPVRLARGELLTIDFQISPLRDEHGKITHLIPTATVVEERVRAQEELKQLNASLEERVAERTAERDRVWRNSRDLLVVIDRKWKLLAVNPAVTGLVGYAPEEAVGRRFSDYLHPDDLASAAQSIRAAAKGPVGDFEARLRAKDGSWRWFSWSAAPGKGEAYVSGRDVTLEKERQAQLEAVEAARKQADALYRAHFENTPEALFVIRLGLDGSFLVEETNPAHQAGVGFRIEDIRGKRIEDILPPDIARRVLETYRQVVESGEILQYREVFDLTGDPQHWDTSIVPVRDESGRITRLIGSSRNVTRQVIAEEGLRQSQKMEAIGQLTGGVAHDFNNLLSPIVGGLDMLQRRGVGDDRAQRMIGGALAAAERAQILVQRLLAFARRQPLQPKPIDLGLLVREMADLVSSTTGPNVSVVVDLPDRLPHALADANQLEMALLNLSVNARDAMPAGGRLTISAAEEEIGAGHRSNLPAGRYLHLSVADTGHGMDEATLARAVEPFFSTKGPGQGTGLGLSMVHGLAAQLGGALQIGSRPGLGTKVELWLPVASEAASIVLARQSGANLDTTAGTALLVDDEQLVRTSTADMLADLGYEVVEADSADAALDLVKKGTRPNLVVTDHLMPGMSGTELARELHERLGDVPILIISGYADLEAIAPDLPRLAKPFRQADLAAALSSLRGKAWSSGASRA